MNELTREDVIVLVIEECGEVIQAATKCLRFGWNHDQPDYGINSEVLAREIGDLLGAIEALPLNKGIIDTFQKQKIRRAVRLKNTIIDSDSPPSPPQPT